MAFVGKWIGLGASQGTSGQLPVEEAQEEGPSTSAITKAEFKRFGLENFGNTCYANSVLQALYFCHPFRELVIQAPDNSNPVAPVVFSSSPPPSSTPNQNYQRVKNVRKPTSPDVRQPLDGPIQLGSAEKLTGPPIPPQPPSMFSALRALFVHIAHNSLDKGIVAPRAFVEKLKKENEAFRTPMHQDAHEFLNFLLNKVSEDLQAELGKERSRSSSGDDLSGSMTSSSPSSSGTSQLSSSSSHSTLVQDLFKGVLTSETRCLTCETLSSREEAFLDLSIDIEQNSSVTACLRQFSASEMLCQKNKFFCDSCCGLQEAEKRMKIKQLPNVLALHLKRFKYQENLQKYIKLTYRVAFPLELRLFNTVDDADDPDRLYELFAIVVHIGNGPNHGHYVAIVKSRGGWVVFDDDTVDMIKETDIPKYFGDSNSGCAYVLYYQAVDLDLVGLGLRNADPESLPAAASTPLEAPNIPTDFSHQEGSDASEPNSKVYSTVAKETIHSLLNDDSPPPLSVSIPSPANPLQSTLASPIDTAHSSPHVESGTSFVRSSPSRSNLASANRGVKATQEAIAPVPAVPPIPTVIVESVPEQSSHTASVLANIANSSGKKSAGWLRWTSSKFHRHPKSSEPTASQGHHERLEGTGHKSASTFSSHTPLTEPSTSALANGHTVDDDSSKDATLGRSSSNYSSLSSQANLNDPTTVVSSASDVQSESTKAPFSPGHRKSQASFGSPPVRPARSERRPFTAGASPSSENDHRSAFKDVGMPSSMPATVPMAMPRRSGQSVSTQGTSESHGDGVRRRNSVAIGSGPPPTSPFKRPPRKLSFSGGMLGFGRKDRDRDRHHHGRETENNSGTFPPVTA